jgi:hypothetical protein
LFEHNIVQNIVVDNSHGINGPYNLFFRNRAENAGIYMNNSCGDSTAFMGNEVTRSRSLFYGLYTLTGNGNYQYGNNVLGVNQPSGTQQLPDSSYYLSAKPSFMTGIWPSIGYPNTINTGTISAYGRYFNLPSNPTVCTPPQIVLKEESLFLNVQYTPGFFVFKWVVSEIPAPGKFVIQKSIDGIHFYSVDSISSNNSAKMYFFQLKDQSSVSNAITYFRIRYAANGGMQQWSNVSIVKNTGNFTSCQMEVYPNPAATFFTVCFLSDWVGEASMVVFESGGKEVMHRIFDATIGRNEVLFHVDKLKAGQYFVLVSTNREIGIKSVQIR